MNVSIIAAVATNYAIGNNNDLLWHLPNDLKFFKQKTLGHHIIMGRNTFESIGGGKPLPKRTSIIITRNAHYSAPCGCLVVHSMQEALELCKHEQEVFICGGAQIYSQSLDIATTMYITHVHNNFNADTFFPKWDENIWLQHSQEDHYADDKHAYNYSFATYCKAQ